eukprot:CCRYP_016445-RA/>CCRYP_016445-RA protein AED:0.62 eAED:0.37 QI:0/0/0/1/0/0/2/0/365
MSSQVYKAQDVATIRATIKNEGIDPIQVRPDCMKLIHFLNQVTEGAKQVECEYSNYGMMWVCLPQVIYFQITNENITAPVVPPLVPPFNEHGTPAYNAQVQVTWQKNKELSDQRKNTEKALIEIAKTALDANYRGTLTQLFTGLPDRKPVGPQRRDIAGVIKQINDGIYSHAVGHKKPDNDLVTIGEKIILDTGLFAIQYGQWRKIDPESVAWAKFDEFWTAELDLWHETTRTASQHGYGGNATGSNQGLDMDDAEQAYCDSLQRFGEANRDNAATFNSLAQTNSHMAHNIATDVKTLQQQMQQLILAVQTKSANNANPPIPTTHALSAPNRIRGAPGNSRNRTTSPTTIANSAANNTLLRPTVL